MTHDTHKNVKYQACRTAAILFPWQTWIRSKTTVSDHISRNARYLDTLCGSHNFRPAVNILYD